MSKRLFAASLVFTSLVPLAAWGQAVVNESARQVPLAYDVDVVVVGGSTGAVAAAVSAAEAGAKVFLAAPHPYLGDDMTATLRLWLEPGEVPVTPLARSVFADDLLQPDESHDAAGLKFTYTTNPPSAGKHRDTNPPKRLGDGRFADPPKDSIEYNADVTITADLSRPQAIKEIRLHGYCRSSGDAARDFDIEGVAVATSADAKTWTADAAMTKAQATGEHLALAAPVDAEARYVKLVVRKPAKLQRLLLGEIEIIGAAPANAAAAKATYTPPRPLHVKKTLDEALLAANVKFLYSCYATDLLRDAAGNPAGIVMANRAGRQAVRAKTIIDATERGRVARLAGATAAAYSAGVHTFRRVVIGGTPRQANEMTVRTIAPPFHGPFPNQAKTTSGDFPIIEYTLQLPMAGDTCAAWAAADQRARSLTYHPEQQFTSDVLFEVPPDAIRGRQSSTGAWASVEKLPIEAFQPRDVPHVFVLGGCADISRAQAEKLLRPVALMDLGARIGQTAAAEAKSLAEPKDVRVAGAKPSDAPASPGEVRETRQNVRPTQQAATVPQEARSLPVVGSYDVVVIGGGTGGAPAGIASARAGAKTLVVEYLSGLGGVGTIGAISTYCAGNRVGFTAEVGGGNRWVIEQKIEWWRSQVLKAGGDIWYGGIGCGALVEKDRVVGAIVATPQGRGVVLAKVVIDATGNADVAAAAGAPCVYTDQSELAMQGTGLPPRRLGTSYTNTDFTIADETDLVDIWHLFIYAKNKYPDAFDQGQLVDTRERRAIVGEHTLTILDEINRRTYADTICQALGGSYDTHGYTVDPYLLATHPNTSKLLINVPYRCMLPKGLDGLLVAAIGASVHRDALPLVRMQPDIQNQGYAAGRAAAMAAETNTLVRNINIRELQKHLVEIGNLQAGVLDDRDTMPLGPEKIAAAVKAINAPPAKTATKKSEKDGYSKEPRGTKYDSSAVKAFRDNDNAAAAIMTDPQQAIPLLRKAYAQATGQAKFNDAFLLAILGDATGIETLIAEVQAAKEWDRGWNYRGMGQFGNALSPLDRVIVALGRTRDRRGLPAILDKIKLLTAEHDFSHHRAVGLALEALGDPAAAQPLAELLAKSGMAGYVHPTVEVARTLGTPGGTNGEVTRRTSIRELCLARALYRCGDYQGLGAKTLEAYTHDLRGHLARHAQAVLAAGKNTPTTPEKNP